MNLVAFNYNTNVIRTQVTDDVANGDIIDVRNQGGILVTTSRNVAAVFGKEHKNVLADIRNIIASNSDEEFGRLNFQQSTYRNEQNKEQPEYLLTRDGTMLLIMGYTGEKALALKTAYIKRFNEMEQALKSQAERVNADQVQQLMSRAQFLLNIVGIEGNQMALALDKVHKNKTGESLLALAEVQLIAPTQKQLLNPTQLGEPLGLSGIKVNKKLEELGLQRKTDAGWEPTEEGLAKGAVMLDTGKRHSNGTPIRQLKWPSDILDQSSNL